jgi:hypothetical protein
MDRNEFSLDPRHVSVAPKMILEPMVLSALTLHLFWVKINIINKQTKTIFPLIYAT